MASAHILAMTASGAAGERFLVSSGPVIALKEIGGILREHFGDAARRVPSRSIPDVVVRVAALFGKEFRAIVPDLGYVKKVSNEKARRVLGWEPRGSEEAIVASGGSLIRKGLVKG